MKTEPTTDRQPHPGPREALARHGQRVKMIGTGAEAVTIIIAAPQDEPDSPRTHIPGPQTYRPLR